MTRHTTATLFLLVLVPIASAQDARDSPDQPPVQVEPGEFKLDEPTSLDFKAAHKPFGADGTSWWSLGAGAAFNGEATDVNAYAMTHFFIAEDFEFNLTFGGFYHDQDGEDAASGNFAIGFRWHFKSDPKQSCYFDFGIGLLGASGEVPDKGTEFNFTPRAGVGTTIKLSDESQARLDLGVRWHHISNANTSGGDDNPSRDSIMVYAGVSWPF